MRPEAILKRWIEILAGIVLGMHEAWRSRRALVLAVENKRLVIRGGNAAAALQSRRPSDVAAAARKAFVTLELPPDAIVRARISVPARACEFLGGVVRNQIERLSPWPAAEVVYGFDAAASLKDPETLDTRVLITPRANIDAAKNELAALGVAPDAIVAREAGEAGAPPVVVWSRYENRSGRGLNLLRHRIAVALAIVVALSGGVSAWSLVSASTIRSQSEETAARSDALQKELLGTRATSGSAALDPAERAWKAKETSPSGVVLIETLSQALPDNAYLTELTLQQSTLRITGLTGDAPSLIAPLEGAFAEVHFFAPTTRGPDGRSFWFHIEARVDPRHASTEHASAEHASVERRP
jgi:general secretion pathway protein L